MSSPLQVDIKGENEISDSLPTLWNAAPLKDLAEFKNGYAYKSSDWLSSGVPVVKIANVGNGEVNLQGCSYISEKLALETSEFSVGNGDFLIALSGVTLGNSGTYHQAGTARINQRVARIILKPNCGFHQRLLELFFESPAAFGFIWSSAKGAAQPNISTKSIEQFILPIPPLAEQEKIVEILEEQLSRLDAALASVRAVREKSARFRRSLLHAAFTGALTGHDTSDGTLPPGWERKELEDIAETQLGKMLNSSKQTGSALKPYLRNINLQWGRIDLSDVKEMDIFDNEMRQFMLAKGDVLVCEGGEPGRSAVWNLDIEMGFQNAIHRIRPRERLSSEFACYQFEWLVKNGILDELFTGVTIKHFSQQKLRKVEFVVPSLNEQEKIVQILEEQFSRLDASLVIADAIETKASNMRRSLLHAAFTGELTRGWREGAHV